MSQLHRPRKPAKQTLVPDIVITRSHRHPCLRQICHSHRPALSCCRREGSRSQPGDLTAGRSLFNLDCFQKYPGVSIQKIRWCASLGQTPKWAWGKFAIPNNVRHTMLVTLSSGAIAFLLTILRTHFGTPIALPVTRVLQSYLMVGPYSPCNTMFSPSFRLLLSTVSVVTAVKGWYPGQDAPGLVHDTAPPSQAASFNFDVNTGFKVQEQTADEDATVVEYTSDNGSPYPHPYEYQRIGDNGPLLLQDTHLLELFGSFDRERIPERVVHARGAGAHGYFEVTNADFAKNYTMMDMLSENGLRTPITVRFSTVGGESGSADEARDPRGFAVKFRTRKGILDLVMNNTPVFFIRDPTKFPPFIHTQKRHPASHLRDKDMFWDYLGSNPEALYQVMRLFSDLGTPYGFRHMHAWTGHTYRWVKQDGSWVYVKLYAESMQGVKNFTNADATTIAGSNPDFATQDLYESIQNVTYPGWTMYAQVLTPEAAETFKYNVLDLTKDWGFDDVPKTEIGRFYLTQNPDNYFAEIEQAAFTPSHIVDGWAPSADPVLQARLFSYSDTQRYRLGVNHMQIPVNAPINAVANFQRDGTMNVNGNQGSRPNYLSTLQKIQLPPRPYVDETHQQWTGGAVASLSAVTELDFDWPRRFWNSLSAQDQQNLIGNVVGHLGAAPTESVRQRMASLFYHANATLGQAIADGVGVTVTKLTFPDGPTWFNTTKDTQNSTLDY